MVTTQSGTEITILCHGLPMRSLKQLAGYLLGDEHDQTKVEIQISSNETGEYSIVPFPLTPFADSAKGPWG